MVTVWKDRENAFALQLKKTDPDTRELTVLTDNLRQEDQTNDV